MENQVANPPQSENKFKFPTEIVDLPSKGLIYPEGNPLSDGKIEMKYMTAKEEDILTNQNYIKQGIVLDKLLQSLIVSKINYNDLIVGDKNMIMVASRILGYGKDYTFKYGEEEVTVDLTELNPKYADESLYEKGKNEFDFILPHSKTNISFKLITHGDDRKIDAEIKGLKKMNKNISAELTTRLKHVILSIDGDYEKKTIRDFVDNYLLARDSRALREYIKHIQPNVDLSFDYVGEMIQVPITVSFFWPDSGF
tara:strand:- start:1245 stop:2006 length:762 start_codon:yes stop_codon:yes gene_type:complete